MHERACCTQRATRQAPCRGPGPAHPHIRRALLELTAYGFALPANAAIAGTNTTSMHVSPNATSIAFDMTRSISRDMEGIGALLLTGDKAEARKMLLNRIFV